MAVRREALGKGLDSLIPMGTMGNTAKKNQVRSFDSVAKEASDGDGEPTYVRTSKVEPNRDQPRKQFNEDGIEELADSIKKYGLLTPLLVREKDDYYEIIAGERRWRAAKLAGLDEIPVIIKDYSEREILEISLIENIQREDLNPVEEAMAFKRLMDEFGLKQDELAEHVSKSRAAVANSLRLLKLSDEVRQMIIDEKISSGHARALISIQDKDLQYDIAMKVFDKKLSVRETEKLVKTAQNAKKEDKKAPESAKSAIYEALENKLKGMVGSKVHIHDKGGKGKIEIEYYSEDDLQRLLDLFSTIQN